MFTQDLMLLQAAACWGAGSPARNWAGAYEPHSKTRTCDVSSTNVSRSSEQVPLISVWVIGGNKGFTQGGKPFRSIIAPNLHNFGSSKLVASFVIRVPGMAFEPLPGDTVAPHEGIPTGSVDIEDTVIEVMLDLHTNATEQCFVEARRRFDAKLFRESVPRLKELEQTLRDHDAAFSMGVDVALGTHTVTVFADGPQLFVRDSARRGFHAISGLHDTGKLVGSVLYVAK